MTRAQLEKVFVGRLRDELNVVETSHSVSDVCGIFGSFIKFVVLSPITNVASVTQPLEAVYGANTTEKDLPSNSTKPSKHKKVISFNVTQQHVKNVGGLLVECEECHMWRLLFSKRKLSPQNVLKLSTMLEDMSYTCGTMFEDVIMPAELNSVCIRSHQCFEPVEKLYYSSGFQDSICIYCCKTLSDVSRTSPTYPQCADCVNKPPIKRIIRGGKK